MRALLFITLLSLSVAAQDVMEAEEVDTAEDSGARKEAPAPPKIVVPTSAEIEAGIERGLAWLLANQNSDGSWGSARRTKDLNIYAPVPGAHHAFQAGTTGLCLAALLETGDDRPETRVAIDACERWLEGMLPRLRRATPTAIYNDWGHAYCIQALCRLHAHRAGDEERQQKIRELIAGQIDMLKRYEVIDGGWAYYDFRLHTQKPGGSSTSFLNGTCLIALREAEELGVPTPPVVVDRAVAAIRRQRNPDFTYLYGEYFKNRRAALINRSAGSLGRTQVCNAAMRMWGDPDVTDEVLDTWLDRLWARNGWLSIGRKRPVPHESWFAIAGYFYYYGHYYASYCIEMLPEERQSHHKAHLARILLDHQERDGSWFDYPLYDYGHAYGTGFALASLVRCRP